MNSARIARQMNSDRMATKIKKPSNMGLIIDLNPYDFIQRTIVAAFL